MDGQPSAVSRDFNVLTLRKRRQAAHRVMELLRQEGSAATVGADWAKLRRFVNRASLKYRRNAYHGWPHAVDVTQTAAWLVTRTSFRRDLPPVDRFWLLIAAIVHDVDHPGHNNEWEVQMGSALAAKYGNKAVLEHHSLELTEELLRNPKCRFTDTMSEADRTRGHGVLTELVLATDFSIHPVFTAALEAGVQKYLAKPGVHDAAFRMLVLKALLKSADIGNTTQPFEQAKTWGRRVMAEFHAQGRMEKEFGLPVGQLNDEERVRFNQAQIGFIKFLVLGLFQQVAKLEPEVQVLVDALHSNLQHYEAGE
jgi:cAMP-specific phosphodiesterase